jgi:RNA polymerase sigma-70 factor (ECF subfamily)
LAELQPDVRIGMASSTVRLQTLATWNFLSHQWNPDDVTGGYERNAAFEREAMPHLDGLLGAAVRITQDRALAEDLVQETMLRAWKAFDRYQTGTNCKGWLFRIMFNLLSKHRRRIRVRPETVSLDHPEAAREVAAPEESGAMSHREILAAIDGLPADQRGALVLAVEGFKCREIAGMLKIPIGTVMSRLSRARAILREKLGPARPSRSADLEVSAATATVQRSEEPNGLL